MPPRGRGRKKAGSVKKKVSIPTRRPSTRLSTAAAARESLVIREVEEDAVEVISVTNEEAHADGEDEEIGKATNVDVNSVVATVKTEREKYGSFGFGFSEVKEIDANSVESSVVCAMDKEVDVSFFGTPVVPTEGKMNDTPCVETPVLVDQKRQVVNKQEQEEIGSSVGMDMDRECNYLANVETVSSATKDEKDDADIVNHELDVSVSVDSFSGSVSMEPDTRMEVDGLSIADNKDCSEKVIKENNKVEEAETLDDAGDGDVKVVVLEKTEETPSIEAHNGEGNVAMLESIATTDKAEEQSTDGNDGNEKVAMLESIDTIDKVEEISTDACDSVKKIGGNDNVGAALTDDGNVDAEVVVLERIEGNIKAEVAPSLIAGAEDEEDAMMKRRRQRQTEIFIGGLDREATEEDIRNVFGKIGEIVEIRLLLDAITKKNKGYAFLRYATAALAKQAVSEFSKVEVPNMQCISVRLLIYQFKSRFLLCLNLNT